MVRRWAGPVATLTAAALIGGCSESSEPGAVEPIVPTFPVDDDGVMALEGALASGQLVRREGCLGFVSDNGGEFLLIVWPEGTVAVGDSVRTLGVTLDIGERVSLGGGESPADALVVASDPKLSACVDATGADHVWLGTVGPAE